MTGWTGASKPCYSMRQEVVMNEHRWLSRRSCLAAFASTALMPSAFSARAITPRSRPWPALHKTLDELVAARHGAGIGVGICFGDGAPGYPSAGTLAFDSRTPFDENSIARMYSITKHVTRIATLLLVEDGKLTLDQPVTDVLPEFRNLRVVVDLAKGLDSRPATKVMTMRHLITNTSGLGSWTPGSDSGEPLHQLYRERGVTPGNYGTGRNRPGYGEQPKSLEELVGRVAELPLAFEPGTVLHYSIGFDVMALVIQRVSGMAYDAFLHKRLFRPLDMSSTGFEVTAKDAARLTTLYDATGRNAPAAATPDPTLPADFRVVDDRVTSDWLKPPAPLAGGAGLVSTTRDFLRYARMLLNEGTFESAHIMKPETARLAVGNIQPPGVEDPSETTGSGSRALLMNPLYPPGTIGSAGASGTIFWIDPKRRGAVVFIAQVMYGSPARSPYSKPLAAAIEQDL
jgi:CubicO group peptidase (beta-lactamase class C family)